MSQGQCAEVTEEATSPPQHSSTHVILQADKDHNSESMDSCAICMCSYKEHDEIAWSHNKECRHLFHRECIEQWLSANHEDCPICRKDFLSFVPDESERACRHQPPSQPQSSEQARNESAEASDLDTLSRGMHLWHRLPGNPVTAVSQAARTALTAGQ